MTENEISYKINIIGTPVKHITELINQSIALTPVIDTKDQHKYNTTIQIIKERGWEIKVHYTYWRTLQAQQEASPQDKQEFYQNSDGVVLVYDYGVRKSFDDLQNWIDEQQQFTPSNTTVILLGIKIEDTEFSNQMVRERIEELKLKHPYETSRSNPEILLKLGRIFISEMEAAILLKICIIGNKTEQNSTFGRLTTDRKYPTDQSLYSTGADISSKKIKIGKVHVKLLITIIAGESFDKVRPSYYRGASACLILYDKGDAASYSQIVHYFTEFREHVKAESVPVGLVGLEPVKREDERVTHEEGRQLADQLQMTYYETLISDEQQVAYIIKDISRKVCELNPEFKKPVVE